MKQVRYFDPKRHIHFSGYFKQSLFVAALIPIICIVAISVLGINWGIDFSGGTEMQVKFQKDVPADSIRETLEKVGFAKHQVQGYGAPENHEMLVRIERVATISTEEVDRINGLLKKSFGDKATATLSTNMSDRVEVKLPLPEVSTQAMEAQRQQLTALLEGESGLHLRRTKRVGEAQAGLQDAVTHSDPIGGMVPYSAQFVGVSDKVAQALSTEFGQVEIRRVEFVDSQVSKQLRTDGALAVFYALLAMLIYIAIRFDILFAPGAIVGLVQDLFAALFIFVFGRVEFDLPSIAALLTIVGYSINNTIIVYDRIRETIPSGGKKALPDEEVENLVNKAVGDTLSRTINTSLTVLFTTGALWLLAGGVVKSFALVLSVGVVMGVVSSTFAAPACYLFLRRRYAAKMAEQGIRHEFGPTREDKARGVV